MGRTLGHGRRARFLGVLLALAAVTLLGPPPAAPQAAGPKSSTAHGFSMFGDLKYPADFKHFDYVNPRRPRAATSSWPPSAPSTASTRSSSRACRRPGVCGIFETLTVSSRRRAVQRVRSGRRDDRDPGRPLLGGLHAAPGGALPRRHADHGRRRDLDLRDAQDQGAAPSTAPTTRNVAKVEKVGDRKVRFSFTPGENRELPLIVGQMPVLLPDVLEQARLREDDARAAARQRPLQGRGGRAGPLDHLPPRAGLLGARTCRSTSAATTSTSIRYDYYRDATVALEAFKAGEYDFRQENSAKDWATGYDSPAVTRRADQEGGDPERAARPACRASSSTRAGRCSRTRACARRSAYAFDFEWIEQEPVLQRLHAHPQLLRQLRAGRDAACRSGEELKILEPFRGKMPDEVFTTEYEPPTTDGTGNIRDNLREALRLLERGRLDRQGREAGQRHDGRALRVRDPARTTRRSSASCCPSRRTSSGSASPRACARSTPRSTRSAWTTSTST